MTEDRITTEESTDQAINDSGLNRRSFLKKGAIAGVGVAALYMAPSMSSVTARPAYASITGPAWTGGTWMSLEPLQGEGFAGSVIGNKIYVSHGYRPNDSARMDIYDIGGDSWSPGAPAPEGGVTSELVGATAGGRHYAIGGRRSGQGRDDVYSYSPNGDSWRTEQFLGTPRRGLGAAVIGSMIYAMGGSDGGVPHGGSPEATNEVLDTSETFTATDPAWTTLAPMPTAAMGVYATTALGGRVYVIGGFANGSLLDLVQIYNPGADSWSAGMPMPTPRSNAMAGICGNDHIHVIGGIDLSISNFATHEVYVPSTDSWVTDVDYPVASGGSEFAVGMVTHGSNIHAIGSGAFGGSFDRHFKYTCP